MHRICVVIAVLVFVAQVCLAAEPLTTDVPRVRASGIYLF